MQHVQKRREEAMKKTALIAMVLAILAGFCAGCGKAEKPEKAEPKAATSQEAENWEPETVALPEGHTADDGHDHSAHENCDHSGHNH
jgi:hypothetical protein